MYSVLIPFGEGTALQIKDHQIATLLRKSLDNTITLELFGLQKGLNGWLIVTDNLLKDWVGSKLDNLTIKFVQTIDSIELYDDLQDGSEFVTEIMFHTVDYWLKAMSGV